MGMTLSIVGLILSFISLFISISILLRGINKDKE